MKLRSTSSLAAMVLALMLGFAGQSQASGTWSGPTVTLVSGAADNGVDEITHPADFSYSTSNNDGSTTYTLTDAHHSGGMNYGTYPYANVYYGDSYNRLKETYKILYTWTGTGSPVTTADGKCAFTVSNIGNVLSDTDNQICSCTVSCQEPTGSYVNNSRLTDGNQFWDLTSAIVPQFVSTVNGISTYTIEAEQTIDAQSGPLNTPTDVSWTWGSTVALKFTVPPASGVGPI